MGADRLNEVSFEILDEERYEAVTSLDQVTFDSLEPAQELAVGIEAVSTCVEVDGLEEPVSEDGGEIPEISTELDVIEPQPEDTEVALPKVRAGRVSWLLDEAIKTLSEQGFRQITSRRLLGTVRSMAGILSGDEMNDLFASAATSAQLQAMPDGSFLITAHAGEKQAPQTSFVQPLTKKERQREDRAERRAEREQMVDREKRVANPRRRGKNFRKKGSRMMGRTHGKKKTLDQLIAEMNEPKDT